MYIVMYCNIELDKSKVTYVTIWTYYKSSVMKWNAKNFSFRVTGLLAKIQTNFEWNMKYGTACMNLKFCVTWQREWIFILQYIATPKMWHIYRPQSTYRSIIIEIEMTKKLSETKHV